MRLPFRVALGNEPFGGHLFVFGWMDQDSLADLCACCCFLDTSKVQEPPETPAPVFALRAFKSALFGTPGAEDEERERVSRATEQPVSSRRNRSVSQENPLRESAGNDTGARKGDAVPISNIMASPTKSILMTPGTTSNRRKTVSFGDGVVDNERKQESPSKTPTKTPPSATGSSTSSQWSSGSSDGKKPRSKLTQALMDSREKGSKDPDPAQAPSQGEIRSAESTPKTTSTAAKSDDGDETMNMDEPRSQSGKYWKTEFDSYRSRTDREIRRLVQYRSVAKAYARKKDDEAVRLAEKLKQEEERVGEMERRVSHLASTMVAEGSKADKEQLIQDLTKQTALALQYKHRVTLLRKALEQNGVVNNELFDVKEPQPGKDQDTSDKTEKVAEELRKTQQALEQANSRIEDMRNRPTDLSELQDLAESSQQKASELEKENATLKRSLARVKSEMTKYEGRRKEKETKLKQREAKLEIRIQEYRDRLRMMSQQHRDSQNSLKESFNEERQAQEEQIARLKLTIATLQRIPNIEPSNRRAQQSPRKGYTGVQVYDFGESPRKDGLDDETEEIDGPPSPSPRSKERHYRQLRSITDDPLDLKRAAQAMGIDNDDPLIYAEEEESPRKTQARRFRHTTQDIDVDDDFGSDDDDNPIPPSSPPDLASLEPLYHRNLSSTKQYPHDRNRDRDDLRTTYLTTRSHDQDQKPRTLQRRRSPTKYGLDALAGHAKYNVSNQAPNTAHCLTDLQLDSLPAERILAAQARLRRKGTSRKGHEQGKENIKALDV